MHLSKICKRVAVLFGTISIITGVCCFAFRRYNICDITGVRSYRYDIVEEDIESNITFDEYLIQNPIYLAEIIEDRKQVQFEEEAYKAEEKELVFKAINELKEEEEIQRQLTKSKSEARFYKVYNAEDFYMPKIELEYPWEEFDFGYEKQAYVYSLCQEFEIDYFLIMGVIARESRFVFANRTDYCGYMGVGASCEEFVRKETGNYNLSRWNEYDNLYIGCYFQKHCFDEIGTLDGGLMAYNLGIQGYKNAVAKGVYTNDAVNKAWKFRKLLIDCERGKNEDT